MVYSPLENYAANRPLAVKKLALQKLIKGRRAMSALGQKQTSRHLQPMLPPKADIAVPSLLMHFGYPGRRAADSETENRQDA